MFLIMSALALTVTVLVLVFGVEPRNLKAKRQGVAPKAGGRGGAAAVWANLRAMVTPLPTTHKAVCDTARMIWGDKCSPLKGCYCKLEFMSM